MSSKPLLVFDHETALSLTSRFSEATIVNLRRIVVLQSVVIGILVLLQVL